MIKTNDDIVYIHQGGWRVFGKSRTADDVKYIRADIAAAREEKLIETANKLGYEGDLIRQESGLEELKP